MATQSQRRLEGLAAIRRFKAEYRKADSAGERMERELERLVTRKTLISIDSLQSLQKKLEEFIRLVDSLQRLYKILVDIINAIPR